MALLSVRTFLSSHKEVHLRYSRRALMVYAHAFQIEYDLLCPHVKARPMMEVLLENLTHSFFTFSNRRNF